MTEVLGLYISVPFCKAKCTFCNFASDAYAPGHMPAYLAGLRAEISEVRRRTDAMGATLPERADSVYLGGGTPSVLRPGEVRELFSALRAEFSVEAGAEITVECAPGQIADETLESFQREGVNRLSLGVQSFVDKEAAAVGRRHTGALCQAEIARLRRAGIEDIGVDLIAGLPLQTPESWELSLTGAIEGAVSHVSVYMLEIDEESRLGREVTRGGERYSAGHMPSEEDTAAMYERACAVLPGAGLQQYEISNFAKPGCRSRHNTRYWRRMPYLGFGLDAHSMLRAKDGIGDIRFANESELNAYLARGSALHLLDQPESQDLVPQRVAGQEALEEALFLGLRMNEGVRWAELPVSAEERATIYGALEESRRNGLVELDGEMARLSAQGRLLSNEVFGRLLELSTG